MLFNTVSPAPPTVRPKVAPVIVPALVKESVPLSELILLAEPKVTTPPYVLFPEILRNAPPEETPVPFKVNASAPTEMPFCNSRAAKFATVVPPATVPNPVLF